jgi:hypothetical protein
MTRVVVAEFRELALKSCKTCAEAYDRYIRPVLTIYLHDSEWQLHLS